MVRLPGTLTSSLSRLKIVLDELTEDTSTLAQLCNDCDEFRRPSAKRCEREDVDRATIKIRRALAEAGVDPR
jgi:hypothetical protein